MSLAAAAGAGVAGVDNADAALVQITNSGNYISALGTASFRLDLSGDGMNEDLIPYSGKTGAAPGYFSYFAGLTIGGRRRTLPPFAQFGVVNANAAGPTDEFLLRIGGISPYTKSTAGSAKGHGIITFTDARFNGGESTQALVEIIASSDWTFPGTGTADGTRVTLTRLIFDDSDRTGAALPTTSVNVLNSYVEAVPEPSSPALLLLVLGAGGVLARRRRASASTV